MHRFELKPNCSLDSRTAALFYLSILTVSLTVAGGFAALGLSLMHFARKLRGDKTSAKAVRISLAEGLSTVDLGGSLTCSQVGDELARRVGAAAAAPR